MYVLKDDPTLPLDLSFDVFNVSWARSLFHLIDLYNSEYTISVIKLSILWP